MDQVNNLPCPLYVRAGSDAKRLTPRTGTDSVRTSSLTCSFTVIAPPATPELDNAQPVRVTKLPSAEARSAAVLGGRRPPHDHQRGVADQATSGRQQPGLAPFCVKGWLGEADGSGRGPARQDGRPRSGAVQRRTRQSGCAGRAPEDKAGLRAAVLALAQGRKGEGGHGETGCGQVFGPRPAGRCGST